MIALLKGTLTHKFEDYSILDVNGVGYEVFISEGKIMSQKVPSYLELHIYTHVREDALNLYGFVSVQEKQLFKILLGVSGIGPKSAMTIVNGMEAATIVDAIRMGQPNILTSIPGVGGKTAERIILELKNKPQIKELALTKESVSKGVNVKTSKTSTKTANDKAEGTMSPASYFDDAINALVSLGYNNVQALEVIRKVSNNNEITSLQEIIKLALRELSL